MHQIIIKNGKIVDGSGSPWFRGDIAIDGEKITRMGKLENENGELIIDATDKIVSPGFIDIHTHSDLTLLVNGRAESKVRQGVTTEVIGNCGSSPAPLNDEAKNELSRELADDYGLKVTWNDFQGYLNELDRSDIDVNIVPLVGHGALRRAAMGYEDRQPESKEMDKMKSLLRKAMEAGAFGFSTGLIYPPSSYAGTEELIELAVEADKYNGVYATHMRHEGDQLIEGVREAIKIGEESGIPVQISHHKVSSRSSWGLVYGSLALIHQARKRGVDVSCDVYPYLATSTGLSSIVPDWAHEGGRVKMLARFENKSKRNKILEELEQTQAPRGWENIMVAAVYSEKNKGLTGKSIAEIAKLKEVNPAVAVLQLLKADEGRTGMIRFAMCEDDLEHVLTDDLSMVGSDASAKANYGSLAKGQPHPRAFGTFPRVLGKYVREKKIMSLEKAVYKMTGLPAWRLQLFKKGLLKKGFDADITIFDPEIIEDKATFTEPFQYAEGIEKVIVNGRLVLDNKNHLHPGAGKVIRKK